MNRYGDTPLGMVESALEFIRIAESHDFRAIILSMKASNPKVMIQAYRLLVQRMDRENMRYPLHLGVTEAGDGEDGRIKSAIGIGSLLLDGLGDTILVSLTEDSVYEIPVARALADKAMALWKSDERRVTSDALQKPDGIDPYQFSRRTISPVEFGTDAPLGVEQPPRVVVNAGMVPVHPAALASAIRAAKPKLKDTPLEGLLVTTAAPADAPRALELARALGSDVACLFVELPPGIGIESFGPASLPVAPRIAAVQTFSSGSLASDFVRSASARGILPVLALEPAAVAGLAEAGPGSATSATVVTLATPPGGFPSPSHAVGAWRQLIEALRRHGIAAPVWIRNTVATAIRHEPAFLSRVLESSILTGSLLCDGIGDLVSIETETDLIRATKLAYNVLQGAGARISKTEFVACPSCGRTLFDLQTTTQRIREQTGHLKGVKIAIMGCIVNGPGEMADADFGYVGGAPGKINLYVGKNCVEYSIPAEDADRRLIDLIKAHGKWFEPEPVAQV
jgi:(E)-4-hydroxy-3-methylbut-2-enyl-diphosphate synthase